MFSIGQFFVKKDNAEAVQLELGDEVTERTGTDGTHRVATAGVRAVRPAVVDPRSNPWFFSMVSMVYLDLVWLLTYEVI